MKGFSMDSPGFCRIDWRGRSVELEFQWIGSPGQGRPLLIFLHEGLGSISLWRDYPASLCAALGCTGLVYSRPGYGRSSPRDPGEHWEPNFLERQACEVLPALLQTLNVNAFAPKYWLFGHSDGGSIALIHAAHHAEQVNGIVVVAPHVMVEPISIHSIEQARAAYLSGELRQGLARHHQDPDSAFWGWNNVWLSPAFRGWSIEPLLPQVRCPVLAIQGTEDAYGTLAQIERIQALSPNVSLKTLTGCGHSPHRERPEALTTLVQEFFAEEWQPMASGPNPMS